MLGDCALKKLELRKELGLALFRSRNLTSFIEYIHDNLDYLNDDQLRIFVNVLVDAYMEFEQNLKVMLDLVDGPDSQQVAGRKAETCEGEKA